MEELLSDIKPKLKDSKSQSDEDITELIEIGVGANDLAKIP
jgi:hypothetical protein